MYVSADRTALENAAKKGLFARAAKQPVKVDENLVDEVEKQLVRRVVDLISLQRKAGKAVAGYEKVKGWLQMEEAEVLIQAVDGSGRGKSKLRRIGFGIRSPNCDTWGARLWWTHLSCCRGSSAVKRRAHKRGWQRSPERIDELHER